MNLFRALIEEEFTNSTILGIDMHYKKTQQVKMICEDIKAAHVGKSPMLI